MHARCGMMKSRNTTSGILGSPLVPVTLHRSCGWARRRWESPKQPQRAAPISSWLVTSRLGMLSVTFRRMCYRKVPRRGKLSQRGNPVEGPPEKANPLSRTKNVSTLSNLHARQRFPLNILRITEKLTM